MDANRKTGPQFGTITPTNVRTSLGRAAALVAIMAAGTIAFVATPSRVLSQVTQIVAVERAPNDASESLAAVLACAGVDIVRHQDDLNARPA